MWRPICFLAVNISKYHNDTIFFLLDWQCVDEYKLQDIFVCHECCIKTFKGKWPRPTTACINTSHLSLVVVTQRLFHQDRMCEKARQGRTLGIGAVWLQRIAYVTCTCITYTLYISVYDIYDTMFCHIRYGFHACKSTLKVVFREQ